MRAKSKNQISPDESVDSGVEQVSSAFALANLLAPDRVVCNVTARSKKHCLEIVSRLLTNDQDTLNYAEVFDTIYQREKLGSTGIGAGFALPHGRVNDLESSIGAFLMLTKAIDFDVEDEDDVDMIFALAVPKNSDAQHLQDLSAIANLLSNTDVRERVAGVTSSTELYQALMDLSEESDRQSSSDNSE